MCDDLNCDCCDRSYLEGVADGFVFGVVVGYRAGYNDGYRAALPKFDSERFLEEQRQMERERFFRLLNRDFNPRRLL